MSGQEEFGPCGGSRARDRRVVERSKGEHGRLFGLGGKISSCRVEAAGVEEQDVTGFEAHRGGGCENRLVFREICAEKQGFVESFAGGGSQVGGREHLQAAIVQVFGAQSNPDVDQIACRKGPVPRVLVPAGITAETGLLGHDAVVVGERHDDAWPKELLEAVEDAGQSHKPQKYRIPTDGLAEPSNGTAAFRIERFRGTGIVQVGFIFDITELSGEVPVGDGANLLQKF